MIDVDGNIGERKNSHFIYTQLFLDEKGRQMGIGFKVSNSSIDPLCVLGASVAASWSQNQVNIP